MFYKYFKFNALAYILFSALVLTSSCLSYKKTLYFQGGQPDLKPVNISETYKLRKGDIIQIKIFTSDPQSSEMLNIDGKASVTEIESQYFTGYYVNDSGYVELPLTGKIMVEGYTIMQVDSLITKKARDYFNFYTVDVKFASFKYMALGEFKIPGQYFVANETCTIYEAIGIAGDASDFADKQKVQLIRTLPDGSKKIFHLDLTDYSGFSQENYYIQPNDIIYIQPQKAKVFKQNVTYISIGFAALSALIIIATRLKL